MRVLFAARGTTAPCKNRVILSTSSRHTCHDAGCGVGYARGQGARRSPAMAKHQVRLTSAERKQVQSLLRRSSSTAIQNRRARILLAADVGGDRPPRSDVAVAAATYVDPRTVARVRAEFVRYGLERTLTGRKPVYPSRRKLSDVQEAEVLVLAQSAPPDGHARWSLRLLGKRLVELEVVEGISPETVRSTLKKTISNPGGSDHG